jgi:hypothetical protein
MGLYGQSIGVEEHPGISLILLDATIRTNWEDGLRDLTKIRVGDDLGVVPDDVRFSSGV